MGDRVQLVIRPRESVTWKQFCNSTAPHAVALDGYVTDGPRIDFVGRRVNFNHHDGVARWATRATCAQVALALRTGLPDLLGNNFAIFVNDCDEDVCLAVWLLRNQAAAHAPSALNRILGVEDLLDTTGGFSPLDPRAPILGQIAWIFAPYRNSRELGTIADGSAPLFSQIIDDVGRRISQYVAGYGETLSLNATYYALDFKVGDVAFVTTFGPYARLQMSLHGIRAFVSCQRIPNTDRWSYTIAKAAFHPFDVAATLRELAAIEPGWGGGDTVGGSPRDGSTLSPQDVAEVIRNVQQKQG